jgi:hypothetical protein
MRGTSLPSQSPVPALALTPPAGNSSLNAAMNLAISGSVPTETRNQSFIGGNFRPTNTPRFLIRVSMPPNDPRRLSLRQIADILGHMLKANGFPAGKSELDPKTESLKQIQIEAINPKSK